MKALVSSLATAVVFLCLVVLIKNGLAQAMYTCGGPYDGCTYTGPTCFMEGGNCPDGVMYKALKSVPISVWSCVPAGLGCAMNVTWHYCLEYAYDGQVMGECGNLLCTYYDDVPQCTP